VAIKIIASYTEDQIITSDPSQLLSIRKAKQELAAESDSEAGQEENVLAQPPETPPLVGGNASTPQ
jgi:hypothetical protein